MGAFWRQVSGVTLCPLGQPKKAVGHEPQIGPCVATSVLSNRDACQFQGTDWRRHDNRNETTGEENKLADSHGASSSLAREDHSQEKTH